MGIAFTMRNKPTYAVIKLLKRRETKWIRGQLKFVSTDEFDPTTRGFVIH